MVSLFQVKVFFDAVYQSLADYTSPLYFINRYELSILELVVIYTLSLLITASSDNEQAAVFLECQWFHSGFHTLRTANCERKPSDFS